MKKKHFFFYAGVSDKKTCTWAKTGLVVPAIDREPGNWNEGAGKLDCTWLVGVGFISWGRAADGFADPSLGNCCDGGSLNALISPDGFWPVTAKALEDAAAKAPEATVDTIGLGPANENELGPTLVGVPEDRVPVDGCLELPRDNEPASRGLPVDPWLRDSGMVWLQAPSETEPRFNDPFCFGASPEKKI